MFSLSRNWLLHFLFLKSHLLPISTIAPGRALHKHHNSNAFPNLANMHFQSLSLILALSALIPTLLLAAPSPEPTPEPGIANPGIVPDHDFGEGGVPPPAAKRAPNYVNEARAPQKTPMCNLGMMFRDFPSTTTASAGMPGPSGGAPGQAANDFSKMDCAGGKVGTLTYSYDVPYKYLTATQLGKVSIATLPAHAKIELEICSSCPPVSFSSLCPLFFLARLARSLWILTWRSWFG